jgi:hypothetical protein
VAGHHLPLGITHHFPPGVLMADATHQLLFEGFSPPRAEPAGAEQLSLLGDPILVRVPADLWRSWLEDPAVVTRFDAKRYFRTETDCWPWLAAVSSTGHGSKRTEALLGVRPTT